MPSPIGSIPPISIPPVPLERTERGGETAFRNILESAIQQVEGSRQVAEKAVDGFLSGESDDLHKVALATQRADLELSLFLQVRNKVAQAYQEIMRMQM